MANLWRTQRPRFPQYVSDGNGRDYYIKFNNAGYWEDQFKIQKKPDYEYPKYNNYHTLFHQAAPVKYIPTGNGRETYIINAVGQYHDKKPLASYKLDDFLRGTKTIDNSPKYYNKKRYMSISEKKYNNKLQTLERQLLNRLYKIPLKNKKNKKILEDEENILPNLDNRKEREIETINHYTSDSNIFNRGERLNTLDSMPSFNNKYRYTFFKGNKNKKINKISLKNNLDSILRQSQQVEKYEMNNRSRRGNNETDYNIYKDGRVGCRLNNLKFLVNSSSQKINNRMNTEGNYTLNKNYSLGKSNKKFKKNKLTFSLGSSSDEKRFKTLED